MPVSNGKILMCRPTHFDVAYQINPWMNVKNRPNEALSKVQWEKLHSTLKGLGLEIEYLEPARDLPDMVFTANGGLVKGNKCVLPKFEHKERFGEEQHFKQWFVSNGYEVLELAERSFEGEGDALFVDKTLFAGHGSRTDKVRYEEIVSFLGIQEIIYCELLVPKFYHLDTCFCPLGSNDALYVPEAFSEESLDAMSKRITLHPVPKRDADGFCCNAVVIEKDVVLAEGNPGAEKILVDLGFTVHTVDLSEFQKGGGSAKCLVLHL